MLDQRQRIDLDNYITGHWGEDSVEEEYECVSSFDEGGTARVTGVPALSNPYDRDSIDGMEWERGWNQEDFWMRATEE